jgi:hypothetical protein
MRDYDTQLLESVAVRRRRLRDALLFGSMRVRRTLDENLVKGFIGVAIAAVLCAGSVGWSFIQQQRALQNKQEARSSVLGGPAANSTPSPTGRPEWRGRQVNRRLLQDGLRRAGVPDALYVLPGVQQARLGAESYYFLAQRSGQFVVGVYERGEERIGPRFPSEDQACRAMYDELASPAGPAAGTGGETRPEKLDPATERQARQRTLATAAQIRDQVRAARGSARTATVEYSLQPGLIVDQFGQESGSYLYPVGTAFKRRSLPPSVLGTTDRRFPYNYHRYQVVKAFRVRAGVAAPAFGQPGGGVQFKVEPDLFAEHPGLLTIRWLLRGGYLKRVANR